MATSNDNVYPPFPYPGGKRGVAPAVWEALGNPNHYIEPFCGSAVVLLNRPLFAPDSTHIETINDADALIVNTLRAIQLKPDETAEAASYYMSELDMNARELALLRWREAASAERLLDDPKWCCPEMAGWWIWGACVSFIGSWCDGVGPWVQTQEGKVQHRKEVPAEDPAKHAPGVRRSIPAIGTFRGANLPPEKWGHLEEGTLCPESLRRWMRIVSRRLRATRIVCGDWKRVCTDGIVRNIGAYQRHNKDFTAGFFIDPPYSHDVRHWRIYFSDNEERAGRCISDEARQWCLENGTRKEYRIVLAGYAGEHDELERHGWRVEAWGAKSEGLWAKGMSTLRGGNRREQERLWFSPHCLRPEQKTLF